MDNGIIYMYTNSVNGKKYIGQTTRPRDRIKEHRCHSKRKGTNEHFYNAVRKYGWNTFVYEVLETITAVESDLQRLLNERESYWISFYNTTDSNCGYNFSEGGAARGCRCSQVDVYLKDGTFYRTFASSKEALVELGGKDLSTLYRSINRANSLYLKKYIVVWHGQENSYVSSTKSKYLYYQYDKSGNLVKIWDSVCKASKELNIEATTIIKCCKHPDKYKSYKGYVWKRTLK